MEEKDKWGLNWTIWIRDKFQCRYCGFDGLASLVSAHQMVVDHVRPRCRDGNDDSDNLVTACNCCNLIKAEWDRSQYNPEDFEHRPPSDIFQEAKSYIDRWYAKWNRGYELMMGEARKH
jgi:5-methylcytosine-specific restriction endonuclease McrA